MPSAQDILDIMKASVADLEDQPQMMGEYTRASHFFLFEVAFSSAVSTAFPQTDYVRMNCIPRHAPGMPPMVNLEILAILDETVIKFEGLASLDDVRENLMKANAQCLSSFDPEKDKAEDFVILREESLRDTAVGKKFVGSWSIFLAQRAEAHLANWRAAQIDEHTAPSTSRRPGSRL